MVARADGTLHVIAHLSDRSTQTSGQLGICVDLRRRTPLVQELGERREVIHVRGGDHRAGELIDERSTIGLRQERCPGELVEESSTEGIRGVDSEVPQGAADGCVRLSPLVVPIDPGQPKRRRAAATKQHITIVQVLDHRLRLAQQIREGMFDHSHEISISELLQISQYGERHDKAVSHLERSSSNGE